ncbi:hypothetical protein [Herbaspirillum sp. alder98]|uniref:hypothetical protein n=1 Tax=Herbaspirillum sp. alder98 TaxID=2913096 RepID=UPI001CD83DA1|nr:hypothetical protein [Herbaspirillum sp. alder98]MCA1325670.1 hypothetical protein [Herbaspirillum sp. alder98]
MNDLIVKLIAKARLQNTVALCDLDGGLHVFAYPLEYCMLVGLGVGADAPMHASDLLRRRAADPRRFAGWLPALFNDGSLYVVRRLSSDEEEGGELLDGQLELGRELLN